jgi:hypothetical protein
MDVGSDGVDDYGSPSIAPPMGPFPLDDSVGMKAAIGPLSRSWCLFGMRSMGHFSKDEVGYK